VLKTLTISNIFYVAGVKSDRQWMWHCRKSFLKCLKHFQFRIFFYVAGAKSDRQWMWHCWKFLFPLGNDRLLYFAFKFVLLSSNTAHKEKERWFRAKWSKFYWFINNFIY